MKFLVTRNTTTARHRLREGYVLGIEEFEEDELVRLITAGVLQLVEDTVA